MLDAADERGKREIQLIDESEGCERNVYMPTLCKIPKMLGICLIKVPTRRRQGLIGGNSYLPYLGT